MDNAGVNPGEELLGGFDALFDWGISVSLRRIAINLGSIENGIPSCEQQP